MINLFILFAILIVTLISIIGSFYFVVYFGHPEEKEFTCHYFFKGCVILGYSFLPLQILILPLDIENYRSDYGLSMSFFYIFYVVAALGIILVLVPGLMSMYQSDENATIFQKFTDIICYVVTYYIFFAILVLVIWLLGEQIEGSYDVRAQSIFSS